MNCECKVSFSSEELGIIAGALDRGTQGYAAAVKITPIIDKIKPHLPKPTEEAEGENPDSK